MRRRHPTLVEATSELIRFDPADWPATHNDIELKGPGQGSAFYAWQRWMHARADFTEWHGIDHDAIPEEMAPGAWAQVVESLGRAA